MTTLDWHQETSDNATIYRSRDCRYIIERRGEGYRVEHPLGILAEGVATPDEAKAIAQHDAAMLWAAEADAVAFWQLSHSRNERAVVRNDDWPEGVTWSFLIASALQNARDTDGADERGTADEVAAYWSSARVTLAMAADTIH